MKIFKTKKTFAFLLTGLISLTASTAFSQAVNSGSPSCKFPHDVAYAFGLKPNNVSFATMDAAVSVFYNQWYAAFVTATGAGGHLRVQRPANSNDTVSEGIGYGMLIAVAMGDKTLFDGLYSYALLYMDGNHLMNWQINSGGTVIGNGGATDADEDIAEALIMADKQWGSGGTINYKTEFQNMVNGIYLHEIGGGGLVLPGDNYSTPLFSSYMTPAWYRCWGAGSDTNAAHVWANPTGWVYNTYFTNVRAQWPMGFVPNTVNNDGTFKTAVALAPEPATNHGYDASRFGMRIGLDYLWYGQSGTQIQTFASTVMAGVNANSYINYVQEYWNITNGTPSGSPCSSLQIGPLMVAAMAGSNNQSFVNNTYVELWNRINSSACPGLDYFQDTLALMCALIATGNFPNMVCGGGTACIATTPVPTAIPAACFMLDDLEDGNAQNATNGYWFTFSYVSVNSTPVAPTRAAVSAPSYIVDGTATGTGAVVGSNFAARVSGFWLDNGVNAQNTPTSPATYGGFALATELNPGYRNLASGSCGAMTMISFYIKGTAPCTVRFNLYNPAIDVTGGGNSNQYGNTLLVTTAWQLVNLNLGLLACQNWGAGSCPPVSGGVTYTQALDFSNITSLQWQTSGNATTVGFWVDQVCMTYASCVPKTATPLPTFTPIPGSPTATPLPTNTFTLTPTRTNTPTNTVANTNTFTPTSTATSTSTPTRTFTPTSTSTNTSTNTPANTNTFTSTSTNTPTRTYTSTSTPTNSPTNTLVNTNTSTSTPTSTSTSTYTATRTFSPTSTNTAANTNTSTSTPTSTSTSTNTPTRTYTSTSTATNSPTNTTVNTNTSTSTPTSTSTSTYTATRTFSPTSTNTGVNTSTSTSTPTNTYTSTNTPTRTSTSTSTFTPTNSSTNTPVNTNTSTSTPTSTSTSTSTNSPTNTSTRTNTATSTNTSTNTPTNTMTYTPTSTSTFTSTSTSTNTSTRTFTPTSTSTSTNTFTPTSTFTPTNSFTPTITYTPTMTVTGTQPPTNTPTNTPTRTSTSTSTNTPTSTSTSTFTSTPTSTSTNTSTSTPTRTFTSTSTNSSTPTSTNTSVFTSTATNTATFTSTNTSTNTPTNTPTKTFTPTSTSTYTSTATSTSTSTSTNSFTPTITFTPTQTFTGTQPPTNTPTITNTPTSTNTSTNTPTKTFTSTSTNTSTSTFTSTNTPMNTNTPTSTSTPTQTFTGTQPPTNTPTNSFTPTSTFTPTNTPTKTNTPVNTNTPTNTAVNTATATAVPGNVQLLVGSSSPNPPPQIPGAANISVLQLQMNNQSNSPTTLTSLTITSIGGAGTAGVTVALYVDNANSGVWNAGDTLLGSATFVAGKAVINFSNTLSNFVSQNFIVVTSFSAAAATGTYQMAIQNAADLTGTNATGAVSVTGVPVDSAILTLVAATSTATWTLTPTSTDTSTNTPTMIFTSTLTPTPTAVTVAVNSGLPAPVSGTQLPGASNVPVLSVQMTNPGGALTLTSLVVSNSGSPTGVTSLALWNGATLLTTATISGSTATFNLGLVIPSGNTTYSITSNFSGAASPGAYTFSLTGASGTNGQAVGFSGLSLTGATITIANATFTPTFTPSITPTSTPTPKSTAPVVIYPNPSTGGPVNVFATGVAGTGTSSFKVQIFTTAFRKVFDNDFGNVPTGIQSIKMEDNWGKPLASGLYYVIVTTKPLMGSGNTSTRSVAKLLLVR